MVLLLLFGFGLLFPTAVIGESDGPVVATAMGQVRGVAEGDVHAFRGIPFAAAPLGEHRWKPPAPAKPWTGVRNATQWGSICVQSSGVGSENW